MFTSPDIWKMLAGVAIFLLGIRFLEEAVQQFSGRRFKLFLKKQTSNKLKAIGGGAIVTAVLQSSSLVSLMVLAFVGAGVIAMENALAVILGANLGTTLDSWIVAFLGFKLNIESLALPVAGVAGIGYAVLNRQSKWYNWSRFFLGFSFLFVGLGYMKTGIEELVKDFDISQIKNAPVLAYVGIGLIVTSLIQSSSATMAITLSALYGGVITLMDGMAIVLGSEIGTTIKLFIASIKGVAEKRRVALGNFLFNIINVSLVLIFLQPLYRFIIDVVGIRDSLIALVFFQTLLNALGIIIFYPFLDTMGRFLEKRFRNDDDQTMFIHKVSTQESSEALFAMEKESRYFLYSVLDFTWDCFDKKNIHAQAMHLQKDFSDKSIPEKYEHIKFLHGEIHTFYIQLQKNLSEKEDIEKLDRLISSVRNVMYAAKSIKDAISDMKQLSNSSNDIKYDFYQQERDAADFFCKKVFHLVNKEPAHHFDDLRELFQTVIRSYTDTLKQLYKEGTAGNVSESEITTLLNFNREVFTAFKSFVFGVKDLLFNKEQARYFDELPGFIR